MSNQVLVTKSKSGILKNIINHNFEINGLANLVGDQCLPLQFVRTSLSDLPKRILIFKAVILFLS